MKRLERLKTAVNAFIARQQPTEIMIIRKSPNGYFHNKQRISQKYVDELKTNPRYKVIVLTKKSNPVQIIKN